MEKHWSEKVYVFRPLDDGHYLRYADGEWIEDDGEPDLAFINENRGTVPYVDLPYHKGILWQWMDRDLANKMAGSEYGANPWHYQVENPEEGAGPDWDRHNHPNILAGRSGMSKLAKMRGAANGHVISIHEKNAYTGNELISDIETGEPVKAVENPTCHLCMNDGRGHRMEKLHSDLMKAECNLDVAENDLIKARQAIEDREEDVGICSHELVQAKRMIEIEEKKEACIECGGAKTLDDKTPCPECKGSGLNR